MAVKAQIDIRGLERKIARVIGRSDDIIDDILHEMGSVFTESVVDLTKKDTNRLANGWIDAANKAGVSERPLLPLNKSSRYEAYIKQLQEEMVGFAKIIARADGWIKHYERLDMTDGVRKDGKPRKKRTRQTYYKKQQKYKAKAEKRLDRVIEEYEKALGSEHIIFFNREDFVQRKSNRAFSTVRDKVYGGSGRWLWSGTVRVLELINQEPHGPIVEKHPHLGHPVATSLKLARTKTMSNAIKIARDRYAAVARSA